MNNVAPGAQMAPLCTAMGRGNSYPCFMPRLFRSVLLLASAGTTLGLGVVRQPSTVDHVSNIGGAAIGTVGAESQDTGRLVETEKKRLTAHLNAKAEAFLPKSLSNNDPNTNFLISSFPKLRVVNYVRLPDLVWRPLVATGVVSPHAIAVDQDRLRLYIADTALAKIVWYQLIVLPDKTLISDGRQHVAVQAVSVRNIALDLTGNLWFSGTSCPTPPILPIDAIWKQPIPTIDAAVLSGVPLEALPQYTKGVTKSAPSPLVLDAFSIYYGNDMEGTTKGSIVKAGQAVPMDAASALVGMANNADTTYSIAVTPTALFYGSDNAIYGVLKTKVGADCGSTGDLCKTVSDLVKKPTAMLWDGDGSIYVADAEAGAIYSFASASVSPHALSKIIDAGEVWGLDVLRVTEDQGGALRGAVPSLILALLVFCAAIVTAP